jgi:hypothetical protein
MICVLAALVARILLRPVLKEFPGDLFPHDYRLIWLVLITQNAIGQLITGPHNIWNEMAFSIYYLLLMAISAVIVHHFRYLKRPFA